MLVGWALATLPLRSWVAGVLISVLGVGGVLVRVGRLGEELVTLLRALAVLAWGVFGWLQGDSPLDWLPVVLALAELGTSVGALLTRACAWMLALAAGESAFDPVAAALLWSLGVWVVSGWAGWTVRRRNRPLLALVPAAALLALTLSYAGGGHFVLLLLLGTMLLLLACVEYDVQASRWQAIGVAYADIRYDIVAKAAILLLALVAVAGMSPSFSVEKVVGLVRRFGSQQEDDVRVFAESLGVEQRPESVAEAVFEDLRVAGLPRRHVLGSGPELSEQIVMVISTGDLPPGPRGMVMRYQPLPRYYWRSHTYDRYAYWGWFTGETETIEYPAGEPVITTTLPVQRTVRQEVRLLGDVGGVLHAAGELVVADQDYSVAWRSHGDAFGTAIEAASYRVDSLVTEANADQLRSAGSDYPEWVKGRYLTLPDEVPERVLALARDLTATEPTPYDRVRAIETYLRQFPYTLDVAAPPPGRDVADYFLFELQEGYCDYYATAMVVLARAAGLPARLVVGYATGSYDWSNAQYVVTEADAHAWVEIYFPGYEWVEFEPTASLPAMVRPDGDTSFEWPEPEGRLGPAVAIWGGLSRCWWLGLPGGLVLLALATIAWLTAEGWWLRRLGPAPAVAAVYGRLRRHGRRLAVPMQAGDTPYEFATAFAGWVAHLPQKGRWGKMWLLASQEARHLTDLYVRVSYASRLPDVAEQARAVKAWQRLRWRLWVAWMWQRRRLRR
jgi:transglutaminase-like putative cysteine protease